MRGTYGWFDSFTAAGSDLAEGAALVVAGVGGAGTATQVAADDTVNAVAVHAAREDARVACCLEGNVQVLMGDNSTAGTRIRQHEDDGTFREAGVNNACGRLITGGAVGLQWARFYGPVRILDLDT